MTGTLTIGGHPPHAALMRELCAIPGLTLEEARRMTASFDRLRRAAEEERRPIVVHPADADRVGLREGDPFPGTDRRVVFSVRHRPAFEPRGGQDGARKIARAEAKRARKAAARRARIRP